MFSPVDPKPDFAVRCRGDHPVALPAVGGRM